METIKSMFNDFGFPDEQSRSLFLRKNQFNFNFVKKVSANTITTINTKSEELCPTGTKSVKK